MALPAAAADPGRIQCLSYAPFRADQTPLVAATHVEALQIEEDLATLARLTGCVRTYSIDNGLDQVPDIAARLGMKVIQGLWLGSDRQKNRIQIDGTVALAKRHADVITGIVVGNEVLLRGELGAQDIAAVLREVKAATAIPVTYADVWEYWLRNRDLASAVDFITIHILPYWEDFPISAELAGAHVDEIHRRVAASFPGKEILIGEVGWPSAGRMREGALPSPSNQARVLAEVGARARVRELPGQPDRGTFDQPWKRKLFEGTVGGYLGPLRQHAARTEIRLGNAGLRPSAMDLAAYRRVGDGGCRVRWCGRRGAPAPLPRQITRRIAGCRHACGSASPSSRWQRASRCRGPWPKRRSKASGPGAGFARWR